jgi:hypothetical protein
MSRTAPTSVMTRATMVAALAAVLLSLSPAALATDARIVSYVSYTYLGNSAELASDGVRNLDLGSPTRPLRLELWAFSSPYAGGLNGVRMAVHPLPPLAAGAESEPIDSGPVPFTPPPNGVWYFSMLLTEFTAEFPRNDSYEVRHWIDFQTPEYIGVTPPGNKFRAIEFYHRGLDHYFVASTAQEVSDLVTGVHTGWIQTGYFFDVWDAAGFGASPVCRFYIPPGFGDSHFFSASPQECSVAATMFPWLVKETDAAFYIALPDTATGACASTQTPVYRLWNGRYDSNHRYTTSSIIKAVMIAKGYIAEGYGPDQVVMCAPK